MDNSWKLNEHVFQELKSENPSIRSRAIESLKCVAFDKPDKIVNILLESLVSENKNQIKKKIVTILGHCGSTEALPHLRKISRSKLEDIRVRTAALTSIDSIMNINNINNNEKSDFKIKSIQTNMSNLMQVDSSSPEKKDTADKKLDTKKRKTSPEIENDKPIKKVHKNNLRDSNLLDFFKHENASSKDDEKGHNESKKILINKKDDDSKRVSKSILSFEPSIPLSTVPNSKSSLPSSYKQKGVKKVPSETIKIPKSRLSKIRKSKIKLEKFEIDNYVDDLKLSDEQKNIIRKSLEGKNLFFTGSAGTGKSHTLRELIEIMKSVYSIDEVFVTAPTGISACNINGSTIHSFSGIGLGKDTVKNLVQKILRNKNSVDRWIKCSVLVIDEISMLSGELFDTLDEIARTIRNINEPFGGIQIILCGDFFQLPPVSTSTDPMKFCFQSTSWSKTVDEIIILETVWRQKDDNFVKILNEMRKGNLTDEGRNLLLGCVNRKWDDLIEATCLYPTKNQVAKHNKTCLDAIQGEEIKFEANDDIKSDNQFVQKMLEDSCAASKVLSLKIGAQVILLKNIDTENDLFNGARGRVTEFSTCENRFPIVEFENKIKKVMKREEWSIYSGHTLMATRKQIPLALAWALSIHKSQGMTISRLEVSLNRIFEYGQAYVALSRAKSIEGLRINNHFDKSVIKAHNDVVKFYETNKR